MGKQTYSVTYELEAHQIEWGEKFLWITARAHASGWYDPGYTSGPPDLCYPPEGEETEIEWDDIEIESLEICEDEDGEDPVALDPDSLTDSEKNQIIAELTKDQHRSQENTDHAEADADHYDPY